MGCSPTKINTNTFILGQVAQNVSTIKDLKITEGMLVQENKGNPFENYDQVKVLGEGTFGKVLLGKNKISHVLREIKQIQKDKAEMGEEEEKAIINEINILKSLDHPNIMKVYEYYNSEKVLSIVSELCTGGELYEKISSSGYLSEKVSKYIMKQLLSAVSFCHENGIIHLDTFDSEEDCIFDL